MTNSYLSLTFLWNFSFPYNKLKCLKAEKLLYINWLVIPLTYWLLYQRFSVCDAIISMPWIKLRHHWQLKKMTLAKVWHITHLNLVSEKNNTNVFLLVIILWNHSMNTVYKTRAWKKQQWETEHIFVYSI